MEINKNELYRFPWSKTDNPGGWVEVTDKCDITCEGCYRHQLAGHRSLEEIKQDITRLKALTNCDFITVAGGEPLIYPQILEVIRFISGLGLKSVIFSNGEKFTYDFGRELRNAGLTKIHFHVDSGQNRPGWEGKTETEINALRQKLADTVYRIKGLQCGFHVTVYRSSLPDMPQVVGWCMKNIHKVQHISLIALRGIPVSDHLRYFVNGLQINAESFNNSSIRQEDINITTEEIYTLIKTRFPLLHASAYLNGTSKYDSYKFLIMVNVGSKYQRYGAVGKKTMEFAQVFHHLFFGRYFTFMNSPAIGKKIFFLSFFDKNVRKAFFEFCKNCLINPLRFFTKTYLQSIHIQQPNEVLNGKINLCDDCVNMMVYDGNLINPCQMDEYRIFGGPVVVLEQAQK